MKKLVLTAIAALTLASSAFATIARLDVLGTGGLSGANGSAYYDDMYNMLNNPVYVNDFKNFVVLEKNTQMGVATQMGGMNTALFFRPVASTGVAQGVRPLELMIGGDMGMKWGLGAVWASSDVGAVHAKDLTLKFGLSMEGFEPYVRYNAIGVTKDDNTATETKTTGSFGLGFKYVMGEWAPYVDYSRAASGGFWNRTITLGLGRTAKLGDNARLVYSIYAQKGSRDGVDSFYTFALPLEVGVEGDPNSWLTLRAGASYSVINKSSAANGTDTAGTPAPKVGASIHVNKMDIDATLSNSTGNNIGFDSNTFTNVSVSYKW